MDVVVEDFVNLVENVYGHLKWWIVENLIPALGWFGTDSARQKRKWFLCRDDAKPYRFPFVEKSLAGPWKYKLRVPRELLGAATRILLASSISCAYPNIF